MLPRMKLRLLLSLSLLFIFGCMCCCGGGSVPDEVSEEISEEIGEEIAEKWLEAISGEDFDYEVEEGSISMENPDGGSVVMSVDEVPEDFPLPVYEPATVTMSSHIEHQGQVSMMLAFTTPDSPSEVADFYEKALEKKGLGKPSRMTTTTAGNTVEILIVEEDDVTWSVTATIENGETVGSIMIIPKP